MSTVKQKKLAKLIIKNETLDKPLNAGQMLEKVSYGKISKQPSRILESEGLKEALNELGFSEEGAKKVVEEIMYDKKVKADARLKATDQVFKVHGSYNEKDHISFNQININNKPVVTMTEEEVNEFLKNKLNESTQG